MWVNRKCVLAELCIASLLVIMCIYFYVLVEYFFCEQRRFTSFSNIYHLCRFGQSNKFIALLGKENVVFPRHFPI